MTVGFDDYAGTDTFHATIPIANDDAEPSAANLAIAVQGLADDCRYLKNRGASSTLHLSTGQVTAGGGFLVGPVGFSGTWTDFATASGLIPFVTINGCYTGDIILCWFEAGMAIVAGTQDHADVRLHAIEDYGGSDGSKAIAGAVARVIYTVADLPIRPQTVAIAGIFLVSAGISNKAVRIKLQGMNFGASPDQVGILGGPSSEGQYYSLRALKIRPF